MPAPAIVEAFAATVEAGRFIEALEGWYGPNATMREIVGDPRGGLAVLIEGDHVAMRWVFEFTGADDKVRRMEEIAWQRWADNKIVEEQFFYDPGQMGR